MFKTYSTLAKFLKEKRPELAWIDRDKGQLKKPEGFHSILIPGLLIGFSEIRWGNTGKFTQQGTGSVTVSLVFRNPSKTYQEPDGSNPLDEYRDYEHLTMRLHDTMGQFPNVGERTGTRDYFTDLFYVCEMTYNLSVAETKEIKTIQKPRPEINGVLSTTITIV